MKKSRAWFWGLIFICAAVIIIMSLAGVLNTQSVGIWRILIAVLLGAAALQSIVYLEFFGFFIPLSVIVILFRPQLGLLGTSVWPILAAGLCLAIGFTIIFRRRISARYRAYREAHDHTKTLHDEFTTKETVTENAVECSVSFSSSIKYLHAQNLQYAKLDCSFGALKVYFDQAKLSGDGATVNVSCSFGHIELYVPHTWKVVDQLAATLGGVKSSRAHNAEGAPTLLLTGDVSFGAVEIIYL